MDHNQDVCMHCENCRRRADWDVLRDFFYREQTMLQEQQNAQAQVAAMQLTQYSLQGRLVAAEQERDTFQLQTFDLQHQIGDLHAQYNHLFGRFAREQTDHITTNERYTELWQTYQASESALEQKTLEVQQQDTELQVAHAAVKEMGDMLSKIVYSEDMAAEAIDAANDITDLVLRNQFLAAELARVRSELGDMDEDPHENCQCSPSLTDAPTLTSPRPPSSSFISVPACDEDPGLHNAEPSSACEAWEAYRNERPLVHEGKNDE